MKTYIDHIESPLGIVEVAANEHGVTSIFFVDKARTVNPNNITDATCKQLLEYFQGHRQSFDVPLSAQGTDFQRAVWHELYKLPFGVTCAYQDIANALENPKAVRAVGAANGKNPISIIVPCHRVIGANGTLTGYASGVDRKAWLLKHEGALLF